TKSDNVSILMGLGNGSFNASSIHNTGNSPQFAFSGDFNGDNKLDLAIANSASNNISIFISNGDGTFEPSKTYGGIGLTPYFITMGDFDGDNKLDLAVANKGSNDISIYPGNGDGTFGIETTFDAGNSPVSLVTGDFNKDDKPDLAVVNSGSNTISILIGNGDGTFQTQVNYGVGYSPSSIATNDFNRDYKIDLAIANSGSNTVSILIGNGDGFFQKQITYSVGNNPSGIISGDFNKDNKPDLAITNSGSDTISILIGKRDGTFQKQITYKTGDAPSSIISGDFNKDNNMDLAVTNSGTDNISIFTGNGDGIFASQINFNTGDKPSSITVGDFNGDDKSDLIITNFGSNNFWSFFNTTEQETHFIKINNETLYAEIDTTRACITSLIYKKGSNTQLIAPQWGAYLIDFGSDPWIGNKLKKNWTVESIDSTQSNQIKISFKHALGFANEMLLSWQDDNIDVQCDINAPQAIETFNLLKPGGAWEADQDKWAFPALDTTQTGNFSYPRIHTGIYPQDHSWGTPKEGWLALWDTNVDEVYGFTFSGGFKAKICNGVGAYQHFLFPQGASHIAFHVVKTKPAIAYEAIRDKSTGPYLVLTANVNSIFAAPGNELTYTLVYSNTGMGMLQILLLKAYFRLRWRLWKRVYRMDGVITLEHGR
ncbi:VCBS repeat-containing protein, partial [Candidatus Desantisbacteria bacterium]|nr:VCBS repeat-containing protein [Candidatus Desantisbacteria bacterium]